MSTEWNPAQQALLEQMEARHYRRMSPLVRALYFRSHKIIWGPPLCFVMGYLYEISDLTYHGGAQFITINIFNILTYELPKSDFFRPILFIALLLAVVFSGSWMRASSLRAWMRNTARRGFLRDLRTSSIAPRELLLIHYAVRTRANELNVIVLMAHFYGRLTVELGYPASNTPSWLHISVLGLTVIISAIYMLEVDVYSRTLAWDKPITRWLAPTCLLMTIYLLLTVGFIIPYLLEIHIIIRQLYFGNSMLPANSMGIIFSYCWISLFLLIIFLMGRWWAKGALRMLERRWDDIVHHALSRHQGSAE